MQRHFPKGDLVEETIFVLADCIKSSFDCFNLISGIIFMKMFLWKRPSLFSPIALGVRLTASIWKAASLAQRRFRGRDHCCSRWLLWGFDGLLQLLLEVLPLLFLVRPGLHDWVIVKIWGLFRCKFKYVQDLHDRQGYWFRSGFYVWMVRLVF